MEAEAGGFSSLLLRICLPGNAVFWGICFDLQPIRRTGRNKLLAQFGSALLSKVSLDKKS